ncbi:hypothetical protein F4859DRAFT_443010 [Xylaria cf. heliscus]|nr:hypothetical protein F4859DRAFT_443010 [Xylaria cf. heliscus]
MVAAFTGIGPRLGAEPHLAQLLWESVWSIMQTRAISLLLLPLRSALCASDPLYLCPSTPLCLCASVPLHLRCQRGTLCYVQACMHCMHNLALGTYFVGLLVCWSVGLLAFGLLAFWPILFWAAQASLSLHRPKTPQTQVHGDETSYPGP